MSVSMRYTVGDRKRDYVPAPTLIPSYLEHSVPLMNIFRDPVSITKLPFRIIQKDGR